MSNASTLHWTELHFSFCLIFCPESILLGGKSTSLVCNAFVITLSSKSGVIAPAMQSTPPIPIDFSVALSVCLSVSRLSHSCTLLKPFDSFTRHLAGTLVGSDDTPC